MIYGALADSTNMQNVINILPFSWPTGIKSHRFLDFIIKPGWNYRTASPQPNPIRTMVAGVEGVSLIVGVTYHEYHVGERYRTYTEIVFVGNWC
jgi:hypothetical protein